MTVKPILPVKATSTHPHTVLQTRESFPVVLRGSVKSNEVRISHRPGFIHKGKFAVRVGTVLVALRIQST